VRIDEHEHGLECLNLEFCFCRTAARHSNRASLATFAFAALDCNQASLLCSPLPQAVVLGKPRMHPTAKHAQWVSQRHHLEAMKPAGAAEVCLYFFIFFFRRQVFQSNRVANDIEMA
jgi:hypothetical protein